MPARVCLLQLLCRLLLLWMEIKSAMTDTAVQDTNECAFNYIVPLLNFIGEYTIPMGYDG